jgi:uncharacterized protein (TIGR04255 family)
MPTSLTSACPPVVEMVLGVQFTRLENLTSGHFGHFWDRVGAKWINPTDNPPLEDQFELFDQPRWKAHQKQLIRFSALPFPGRFMLETQASDRMIQVQPTRFHYNWRKRDDVYPSYEVLIAEFEEMLDIFSRFVEESELGELVFNQWELTYVNAFPAGECWKTPADWSHCLPGLFSDLFATDSLNIELENRAAEWTYQIKPEVGRLHVSAKTGRWRSSEETVFLLQTTARGPIGKNTVSLRQGLDTGHAAAVGTFLAVINPTLLSKWGIEK